MSDITKDSSLVLNPETVVAAEDVIALPFGYDFWKRSLDIVGSLLGIIFTSPFMLLLSIIIVLDTRGPILADTPGRVGKDGKLFRMYKFRSMVVGAHDLLHKDPRYKDLLKKYQENSYKLSIDEDPRITRMGRFIRKTSLDELPQLFNIFKGEMNIVGPRAYYPHELEKQQQTYPQTKEFVKIILSAKPGLTGEWQTSGRSDVNFDKRVEMDAHYVKRRSILYDIGIILKTFPAVILGRGAV